MVQFQHTENSSDSLKSSLLNNTNSNSSGSSTRSDISAAARHSPADNANKICGKCQRRVRTVPPSLATPVPKSSGQITYRACRTGEPSVLYKRVHYSHINMTEHLVAKDSIKDKVISNERSPLLVRQLSNNDHDSSSKFSSSRRRPVRRRLLPTVQILPSEGPRTSTPKKCSSQMNYGYNVNDARKTELPTPPTSPLTTSKTDCEKLERNHLPTCPKYRRSGAVPYGLHVRDLLSEPIYEEISSPILVPSVQHCWSSRSKECLKENEVISGKKNTKPDADNQTHRIYENVTVAESVRQHTSAFRNIDGLLKASSVEEWLRELRFFTDAECLNTLQGKPITNDPVIVSALAIRDATEFVLNLHRRLENLQQRIAETMKSASTEVWEELVRKAKNVASESRLLVNECLPYMDDAMTRTVKMISDLCCFIEQRANSAPGPVPHRSRDAFRSDLLGLKEACGRVVDNITLQEVQAIVECVEEKSLNPFAIKWSIFALVQMSQQSPKLALAITKAGGVQALLSVCKETVWKNLWPSALRSLCLLCASVSHAVILFEKVGGVLRISDILRNRSNNEESRREAAGLLAQITAPWTDSAPPKSIDDNMADLVFSLTDTARSTSSAETFLLASAALANLSFLNSSPCEWMLKSETFQVLIDGCKRFALENSLFIKDQVATVLANASAVTSCRENLWRSGGLVLLLCFLQLRPSLVHTEAEGTSLEGIQQKAAIAISRMCSEPEIAKAVARMQGVRRLVQLCKDAKERKFSDAVLVSCLAALRKLASACGIQELEKYNASELVTPKLWDSFLLCSSKQESYV